MGDRGPNIYHNIMNIMVFQPHTLEVESIGISKIGRGMEGAWSVIGEGTTESFASGEWE